MNKLSQLKWFNGKLLVQSSRKDCYQMENSLLGEEILKTILNAYLFLFYRTSKGYFYDLQLTSLQK